MISAQGRQKHRQGESKPMENKPISRGRIRKILVVLLGAAVYALLYALCSQIDESGTCDLAEAGRRFLPAFALAAAALILAFGALLPGAERLLQKQGGAQKPFCTAGACLLIFCCYVPMFLFEYPGSFVYDTLRQVIQVSTGYYSTFQPLLHTLLIRLCLLAYGPLQSIEKCAALYSLLQMLLLAGCFALLCASLSRTCSRRMARLAAAFFCLYPTHAALASNYTKDVLFSCFFALFLAYSLERVCRGRLSRKHTALHILCGALACLMRNNMIYAMAVWFLLLLVFRKRVRALAGCTALSIVLAMGGNAGLVALTQADGGSRAEMLSVPVQQLARAWNEAGDRFTQEEQAMMDEVFMWEAYRQYEPTISDPVKDLMNKEILNTRMGDFFDLWLSVGKKCPESYLDAFLNLALPSLYPYSEYRVRASYIEIGMLEGAISNAFGQPNMVQPTRFEGVRNWLEEHIFETGMNDVPVLRWLFNTGLIFWLLLLFLYSLYAGDGWRALVLMLAVLLWGTYLLGPVMQGRYLYPFLCALPLFVGMPRPDADKTPVCRNAGQA